MREFYRDFAAAYGTCWLVLVLIALLTMSHINTGEFGMIGFPLLSLIYAGIGYQHRRLAREEEEARARSAQIGGDGAKG